MFEFSTMLPWVVFLALVSFFLLLDLGVFHKKSHVVGWREALAWTCVWIGFSLSFCVWVYFNRGSKAALEFLTGYLVEQALSVDNIFVFVLILAYFKVEKEHQHRVLYYGILGAILMRGAFIAIGAELLMHFHWVMYLFGLLLVVGGLKLFRQSEIEVEPEHNFLLRQARRLVPATHSYHGEKFFVIENGRRLATPLFFVLLSVEMTDLIFAIDSIPAIFGITKDPFIVFTSNICAILGLRSMYFLLAGVIDKLRFLRYGLAFILVFIGVKMLIADYADIPVSWSLGIVAVVLALSVILSLVIKPEKESVRDLP